MLAQRWEDYEEDYEAYESYQAQPIPKPAKPHLTLVKKGPKLNKHLRSRCRAAFILIAVLAMAVTVRSGICASRAYALVAVQQEVQQVELENERLRIEIAKLKSPERIKAIAVSELGMEVPRKMYFAHGR